MPRKAAPFRRSGTNGATRIGLDPRNALRPTQGVFRPGAPSPRAPLAVDRLARSLVEPKTGREADRRNLFLAHLTDVDSATSAELHALTDLSPQSITNTTRLLSDLVDEGLVLHLRTPNGWRYLLATKDTPAS